MTPALTPERAALVRAAEILGGQAAVASALGYSDRRNVAPWFKPNGPRLPAEHCPKIERLTSGSVTCEQLRPDIEWEVLRLQTTPSDHQEAA